MKTDISKWIWHGIHEFPKQTYDKIIKVIIEDNLTLPQAEAVLDKVFEDLVNDHAYFK